MRNTTMQDKLTQVLGAASISRPMVPLRSKNVLIANANRGARRLQSFNRERGEESPFPPRYRVPPKKSNPFSVHAYSAVEAPPIEQRSEEPEHIPEVELAQPEPEQPESAQEPASEPSPQEAAVTTLMSTTVGQQDEAESAISLPSNLAWLQNPTPFVEPLKFIVDRVRGAKATVNFTLGESLRRQADLRKQRATIDERLAQEATVEGEQREKLRQLEDMISACALMAEQSTTVSAELFTPHTSKTAQAKKHQNGVKPGNGASPVNGESKRKRRWDRDDQVMCRNEDVLKFFRENPNTNWRISEIVEGLPATKRADARANNRIYNILSSLKKVGDLQGMGPGIYRMAPTA